MIRDLTLIDSAAVVRHTQVCTWGRNGGYFFGAAIGQIWHRSVSLGGW